MAFEVVPGEVREHAEQVQGQGDLLAQALDAARQVSMPSDAYGVLCQPFAMMLDPLEKWGVDTLSQAVEALASMSESLKATAEVYEQADKDNADRFGRLGPR
ncbi:type VII secretion target [Saccharothrix variisporea]|uniref:Excreted virulence factor EspC (Type VII ESX diderm) n=1 Tax=Saccharothrix variisporea TaxID=543527 RepID=A0A495X707_9PSEU|nr:type VII secretion target [Saccharothrix variisporea]RKT69329.1 excreted virulence factor EspC (type VII ESX diderm) [Saccharothrix variisporea]